MEIAFVEALHWTETLPSRTTILHEGTSRISIVRPGKKRPNAELTIGDAKRLQELGMAVEGDGDTHTSWVYKER